MMLECSQCGEGVGEVLMFGRPVRRLPDGITIDCVKCMTEAEDRALRAARDSVRSPEGYADRGWERLSEAIAKVAQEPPIKPRIARECIHGGEVNFQCMNCMARMRFCGPCSMEGRCLECKEKQPRTVDALVQGISDGLEGKAVLSDAEMAREAEELDRFFGEDMKIRIFGHGPRREQ